MEEEKKEEQVTNTEVKNSNVEQTQNNELKVQQESKSKKTIKGKGLKAYIIVIIIIALAITYGCGFLLGKKLYEKENEPKEPDKPVEQPNNNGNNTEKPNIEQKDDNEIKSLTDTTIINKLDNFIKVAAYVSDAGDGTGKLFLNGQNGLTDILKYKMVQQSVINIDKKITKIQTPEKYKNDMYLGQEETIDSVKIDDLNSAYEMLFNEKASSDLATELEFDRNKENLGCPFIRKADKELGVAFLARDCGGTCGGEHKQNTYKYEYDANYYYVYQYVGFFNSKNCTESKKDEFSLIKSNKVLNVNSFEGNEDKFETVIWKFDKNFNFISTENVGVVSK